MRLRYIPHVDERRSLRPWNRLLGAVYQTLDIRGAGVQFVQTLQTAGTRAVHHRRADDREREIRFMLRDEIPGGFSARVFDAQYATAPFSADLASS